MSNSGTDSIRVLHVDDDPDLASVVALHLERQHDALTVLTEHSASDALERLADADVDCIVSDHDMQGMDGLEFLDAVRERFGNLPFVLFTGKGSEEIASAAISAGVTEYLQKGTGSDQYAVLANRIERAVGEYRAKTALQESERQLSTLISNLPGMVYRCYNERGWPVTFVSDGARELTGYSPEELESSQTSWGDDVIVEDERDRIWDRVQTALDAGEPFEVTYPIRTSDGTERWVWERGRAIDADGETTVIEGFITDVTVRKERERELQAEREFTKNVLNSLEDVFYVITMEGDVLRWNDRFNEVTGYDDAEIANMTALDFFPEEHHETVIRSGKMAVEAGRNRFEAEVETKDCERIPYEFRGTPMYDASGTLVGISGVGRDISARRERERKLEQYETLVENVGDPMYVLDESGEYVMVNRAMEELSGVDRTEFIGNHPTQFMYESDYERGTELLFDAIEYEDRQWFTFELRPKGREWDGHVMENKMAPLTDEDGQLIGAVGVIRDVTDRKERERELERYRTLVENVGDPMYVMNSDGTVAMVNEAMADHVGYDREEIRGVSPRKFATDASVDRANELIEELLADDERNWATFEMQTISADGTRTDNEDMIAVLTDDEGTYEGSVGVIRDISERKARERELERYETIIQAVGDPVYTLDEDGVFTFVNDAIEEVTGYESEELIGEPVSAVMAEDVVETGEQLISDLLKDDERSYGTFELDFVTKEGDRVPFENHVALLPLDDDRFRGTAGVVREISERKGRERRLEEFASVVSHDLRNPLNVVQGRMDLVWETGEVEHLEAAIDAAYRMERLIDDLLRLARQGRDLDTVESVAVARVAKDAWDHVPATNAIIAVETTKQVDADRDRLVELFENLFRNAVEHGQPNDENGELTVRVGDTETGFYVEDDGVGIDPDERDDVFERGHTTGDEGTGFGLAIVERIAMAHDWQISVTDGRDGGCRFEIDTQPG